MGEEKKRTILVCEPLIDQKSFFFLINIQWNITRTKTLIKHSNVSWFIKKAFWNNKILEPPIQVIAPNSKIHLEIRASKFEGNKKQNKQKSRDHSYKDTTNVSRLWSMLNPIENDDDRLLVISLGV